MSIEPFPTPPDALEATALQRLLKTQTFGRALHILAHTASTNDDAKALAQRGMAEGTVILAEQQTQGRGRLGRTFASPAGVGIYLSVVVRPQVETERFPQLTLIAAVAAADAIAQMSDLPVALKWPNDVEIHGKKVAGILTEAVFYPGQPPAVVIGIGINVNTTLEQFPSDLHQRVTSLALATGHTFSRPRLIAAFLAHLERRYDEFQCHGMTHILERWLHYGRIVGRDVRYTQGLASEEGTVVGLDAYGALLVQRQDGSQHRVLSGDVVFV